MNIRFITLLVLLTLGIGLISYKVTHALFSDTAQSSDNTFSAAEVFPTATPTPTSTPGPTPTPDLTGIATHLVISEVQINGANANEDFVEIYNPTSSSVDLNGWQLKKRTSTGTETSLVLIGSGNAIQAHGFFLWANDQGNPAFSTSIGADVSNSNNLSENNSIALENPSDVIIDQVGWGTGTNQFVEGTLINNGSDTNKSMERKAYSTSSAGTMEGGTDSLKGNGFDSGDNATDFILRTASQPQNSSSATESP